MNAPIRPPLSSIVPQSAPFSAEQRGWLGDFFAGLLDADSVAASPQSASTSMPGEKMGDAENDGAPWHDLTMPLAERMKLAEGKALNRRMMAAMGQQDCGQCGYDCARYADAIFSKNEERLNLCVPGGKETTRMLKSLYAEIGSAPVSEAKSEIKIEAPLAVRPERTPGSRDNPAMATFVSRTRLNKKGSAKETWHVEFDLSESNLDYTVGDAFGLFPTNDPGLVEAVLQALDAPADFPIGGRTLREVLTDGVSLSPAPDMLFQLFSYITGGDRRKKAQALAAGEDPDGDAATLDVLAAIEKFRGVRPDPEALVEALDPLQPRLYSISSSPKAIKGRVSLTVDAVRYDVNKRTRLGVASTFLAGRINPGGKLRVYVQKAHAFSLPADPKAPIIMIGPGTGVAPFRAFLQERMATKAPGKNWLFFGHQKRDFDFFYEDELNGMKAAGVLTRLSLAWSRDGDEKFYVQDRMLQAGREVWTWIADGAHIYVCGDAQRMAKDVERALIDIVATHGARTTNEAVHFIAELKKAGRYQADVY
ncbi:sulfite reductase subunit alpha [Rhodoplanes sp. Z2-YC6860]|uniref:sulfite reductase subunit alpha n=1 Tax=Rhodoplanes sp. Z2-YC6860 TaxID=674703 RepID=UPI00078BC488|nr:sulfite reductase subunit alpha [Rhodoplanes sp. Z2-YC6860]AMN43789.1 sulfite reductase [Rhodoplanes sp. Z2-YC6860]